MLVKRVNEPVCAEWWFPGGRIHFTETREAAARRKLFEECGLSGVVVEELETVDVILPAQSVSRVSHAITTFYLIDVPANSTVRLDQQASDFAWKKPASWLEEALHPMVRKTLAQLQTRAATVGRPDSVKT
jgi:ADP-ribose pyrophosphatase YjhB (NUDIX family)